MTARLPQTPDEVRAFASFMCRRFCARIVDKRDDEVMLFIARFLGDLGIMDAATFLTNYSTTIPDPTGEATSLIALPWDVGSADRDIASQIRTITHECQHAAQILVDGSLVFAARYLGSRDDRALLYEVPAYGTAIELAAAAGSLLTRGQAEDLAEHLRAYAVGEEQVVAARAALASLSLSVSLGGVQSDAVRAALEWEP